MGRSAYPKDDVDDGDVLDMMTLRGYKVLSFSRSLSLDAERVSGVDAMGAGVKPADEGVPPDVTELVDGCCIFANDDWNAEGDMDRT